MTLALKQQAAPFGKVKLDGAGVSSLANQLTSAAASLGQAGAAKAGGYTSALASVPTYHGAVTSSGTPGPVAQTNGYETQLAGDAALQGQLAAINAQGTTNAANLTAAQQRALAQYGAIPDLSGYSGQTGDLSGAINQTTRDLADAATNSGVSTVAQLRKAYQNQQDADNASLAARGLIRSGALGQHANEDLTAYQQSQYDATQKLLDYLGQAYQNYLGLRAQGQSAAADATNQALQRIIAQINAGQLGGGGAAPNGGGNNDNGGGGDSGWYTPGDLGGVQTAGQLQDIMSGVTLQPQAPLGYTPPPAPVLTGAANASNAVSAYQKAKGKSNPGGGGL